MFQQLIKSHLDSHLHMVKALHEQSELLSQIAQQIADAMRRGGKLLCCGNGGSAADAQHVAAEFVGRYRLTRAPLPAIALTTDTSLLTAVANDFDFVDIFARQVLALAKPGDVVAGITTSGRSPNVLKALQVAREQGALTVGFTGMPGEPLASQADLCFRAPSTDTARIQEAHILGWHIICDLVETQLASVDVRRAA